MTSSELLDHDVAPQSLRELAPLRAQCPPRSSADVRLVIRRTTSICSTTRTV